MIEDAQALFSGIADKQTNLTTIVNFCWCGHFASPIGAMETQSRRKMMELTRRDMIRLGAGATAIAMSGVIALPAFAAEGDLEKRIAEFVGGKTPVAGKITLTAPEIAENGNTVPIAISVESPMSEDSFVASILVLAAGNPNPNVATFHFTPMSGQASASTRIRLAKTQDVIAVAKMNDGSVFMDKKNIKVTIGGCGG